LLASFLDEIESVRTSGVPVLRHVNFEYDRVLDHLLRALSLGQNVAGRINDAYLESLCVAILAHLSRTYGDLPDTFGAKMDGLASWRLRHVIDYVAASLSGPISLTDLAEVAGLSRMHFSAQFRRSTGLRPHEYVQGRRIDHAQQLLASSDLTLIEIALSAGFANQAHFFPRIQAHCRHHALGLAGPAQRPVRTVKRAHAMSCNRYRRAMIGLRALAHSPEFSCDWITNRAGRQASIVHRSNIRCEKVRMAMSVIQDGRIGKRASWQIVTGSVGTIAIDEPYMRLDSPGGWLLGLRQTLRTVPWLSPTTSGPHRSHRLGRFGSGAGSDGCPSRLRRRPPPRRCTRLLRTCD
jgi:AraC-like DNA-binding protein